MKRILTIIVLLISLNTTAQLGSFYEKYFFSASIDPKMLIDGAYNYDKTPKLDLIIELKVQKDNYEGGIICEYSRLTPEYFSMGFIYNRVIPIINHDRVETLTGIELIAIERRRHATQQSVWITGGINNEIRYNFSDSFSVGLVLNTKWRRDLVGMYGGDPIKHSGFIKLSFTNLRRV